MKKASEYHAHADECRMLASRTLNPEHKAMLARMAATWENLAKQREDYVARQQRITRLEASSSDDA